MREEGAWLGAARLTEMERKGEAKGFGLINLFLLALFNFCLHVWERREVEGVRKEEGIIWNLTDIKSN